MPIPKSTSKTTSSTLASQADAIFEYGKVAWILIFKDCNSNLVSDPPILRKRVNPCRFSIILISPRALPRRQAGQGRLALERASFNSKVFSCRFLTLLFLSKKWKKRHVVLPQWQPRPALPYIFYYIILYRNKGLNEYRHLRVWELLLFPEPQPRPACPTFCHFVGQVGLACGWGKSDGFEDVTFWYKTQPLTL